MSNLAICTNAHAYCEISHVFIFIKIEFIFYLYLLADLKNQPIVLSCVTHILAFCGYFKGQEQICFNPTSWHLVTYNFYQVINFDR